jgi:hypothetical protein
MCGSVARSSWRATRSSGRSVPPGLRRQRDQRAGQRAGARARFRSDPPRPLRAALDERRRAHELAHQAQVRNSRIGDFTFIGFRGRLDNVILEDGAFVLHGAALSNVRIRGDSLVPVGAVIRTQAQADALPTKASAQSEFQREVLEVNEEFAEEYPTLYRRGGYRAVSGISRSPRTSFNSGARPTIGPGRPPVAGPSAVLPKARGVVPAARPIRSVWQPPAS